ncbi:MAG TPA: chemotaxis protein CheX [Rugosimonospora sp.]|nr:chemotaxis protein CheX [Rugosimonospora sp.]
MTLQMAPTIDDLGEIAEQVWSSYLDPDGLSPLLPFVSDEHEKTRSQGESLCASVSITGAWHGHVVVSCSAQAAKHAAAALLAMDVPEVTQQDTVDALGELANIVGGNVKSTLPPVCAISLPHVISGIGVDSHWPAAVQVCELIGVWQDEPISISVWQSRSDRAVAAP